jgi:hypothetical protein
MNSGGPRVDAVWLARKTPAVGITASCDVTTGVYGEGK